MNYDIKDSPIHGKLLALNDKIVVENHDRAAQLAQRFQATDLIKTATGNYMVKLREDIHDIDECDCDKGNMPVVMQPGMPQPQTYNQYPDHEVQMARQELYRTAKLAMMTHELLKHVGERQGLEGWVQSKLTRAADYIETVFDYLDYEMRYPSEMYAESEMPTATDKANMSKGNTEQDPTNTEQPKPQGAMAKKPGMTKTPGMVKMGRVNATGNIEGKPEMVPAAQVKTKQQAGLRVVGENASGGASSAGGMAAGGFGNGFLNGGPGSVQRRKKKRTTENSTDTSDGSPHDRGSADSYYGRKSDPHKYVATPDGNRKRVTLTDPAEIKAYQAGYGSETGRKDYGEGVSEGSKTGPKFTGYWKGTDKGKPGKKMVGGSN
jgi:hypothetical protein